MHKGCSQLLDSLRSLSRASGLAVLKAPTHKRDALGGLHVCCAGMGDLGLIAVEGRLFVPGTERAKIKNEKQKTQPAQHVSVSFRSKPRTQTLYNFYRP